MRNEQDDVEKSVDTKSNGDKPSYLVSFSVSGCSIFGNKHWYFSFWCVVITTVSSFSVAASAWKTKMIENRLDWIDQFKTMQRRFKKIFNNNSSIFQTQLIFSFDNLMNTFFPTDSLTTIFSSLPGQLILNKIVSSKPLYSLHVTAINRDVYQVQNDNKCCFRNISHKFPLFSLCHNQTG